jgi:hypothetical protein
MSSTADKVIASFREWDPKNTGRVPSDLMRLVLRAVAKQLDDAAVARLLHDYGKDSGFVEYADFFVWLMGSHWDLVPSSTSVQANYELDNDALGAGAFGTVRRGVHRRSRAVRAIKTVKKVKNGELQKQALDDEIFYMKQIDHPNTVRIYEVFEDLQFVHLAMELCTGGELLDRLVEELGFSERQASLVMQQVLSAVCHLHAFSICHRDLKPQNLLVKEAGLPVEESLIKVADFGLSRSFKDGKPFSSPVGSPSYAAPEVLKGSYTQACDLWSCGVRALVQNPSNCVSLPFIMF